MSAKLGCRNSVEFIRLVALLSVLSFMYANLALPEGLSLPSYDEIGRSLLQGGYYRGLVHAIRDCCNVRGGFIMVDSPSGSGKSQAGVALRQLDCIRSRDLAKTLLGDLKLRVFHLVWDSAVLRQGIYEEICTRYRQEGVYNDRFFDRCRTFADAHARKEFTVKDHTMVWEQLLQYLFEVDPSAKFNIKTFQKKHKLVDAKVVIFVDEFPSAPKDVQTMLVVREALRNAEGVVLILAGTSAKASNAVSLVQGYSTSVLRVHQPWSLLITRLPTFQMSSSKFVQGQWRKCLNAHSADDHALTAIISVISFSIDHGGNPRLIIFAVDALVSVLNVNPHSRWMQWQVAFSDMVTKNKFAITDSWYDVSGGLISQLNLLLEGSTQSELSDVVLGQHFGFRAIPDNGRHLGSGKDVTLADCGGWLYIGERKERIYGRRLQFRAGVYRRQNVSKGEHNWQTTVFSSFERDPLMYFGCCRQGGYFSIVDIEGVVQLNLKAHEVVLNLWGKNSAGSINFQNPYALCNSGSLLEVMAVVASCNAAAVSPHPSLPVCEFFGNLMIQLGLPVNARSVAKLLSEDLVLSKMLLPRCIFPGCKVPKVLMGLVAAALRIENMDMYDFKIGELAGEAKDRCMTTEDLANSLRKLSKQSAVGFIVVRGCNQYWGTSGKMKKRLKKNLNEGEKKTNRKTNITTIFECTIGKIFFFSSSGEYSDLDLENGKECRIILIQVPASVVGQSDADPPDAGRPDDGLQDVVDEPKEDEPGEDEPRRKRAKGNQARGIGSHGGAG